MPFEIYTQPGRKVRVGPRIKDVEKPEPAPVKVYKLSPEEIAAKYGPPGGKGDEEVPKAKHLTKMQIEDAINNTPNINEAAKKLGISLATIYKHMEQHGLKAKHPRGWNGKQKQVEEDKSMETNSGEIITTPEQVEQQQEVEQKDMTRLVNWLNMPEQEPQERGIYEVFGQTVGRLVDEKQRAHGQAFQKIGQITKILYPSGVPVEKLDHFALIVRVLDKLCRIADGNKEAFGESPWRDVAGYGLLGYVESEGGYCRG